MNNLDIYKYTTNIFNDVMHIIEASQTQAHQAVNITLVLRNWYIGKRIYQEELNGENRAQYGEEIIKQLAKELQEKYTKGFNKTNLYNFYRFYKMYPDIFHSMSGKFKILSWTHYRVLLQIEDAKVRNWYENEAYEIAQIEKMMK